MKAISLWQPWASLWLSSAKVHETRHWATCHRGWLLVHAAKRIEFDHDERLRQILEREFGPHWGTELPRGALIGRVNLIACLQTHMMAVDHQSTDDYACGDFSPGRFAWKREGVGLFDRPVPYRGMRSMFDVPDDAFAKVGTQR